MLTRKIKIATVDQYINLFEGETKLRLEQIRALIKKTCPQATESISYMLPAYKYHGILVYFGGFEKHIGFYATPGANVAFASELKNYKTGKGSIQFQHSEPLPLDLIQKMTQYKMQQNLAKTKK